MTTCEPVSSARHLRAARRSRPGVGLVTAAALLAAASLVAPSARAHGDHPHPPGEATEHSTDEAAPPAPIEDEGAEKEGPAPKAKTTPPPPAADPAPPADLPPPDENGESWRPRTLEDNRWRRHARGDDQDRSSRFIEARHFHFELRFGPYSPSVDDEPGAGGAYAKYFGTDPNFYFGLEADWLPVYLPYVGSLGGGFGWGFTPASGKAKIQGTTTDTTADTSLTIFPMYVVGVFRADGLVRELSIPLVPYLKAGVGFGVWNASGPNEDTAARNPSGTSIGFQFALGGAISLNAFDRTAAMAMYEATGIRYANLFAEWMLNDLGSFGNSNQLLVGTSTVVLGVALDF